MKYLNKQIEQLYDITENDYLDWCKKNDNPVSYKETMSAFLYRVRTGRLVKDNTGKLLVKKPRHKGAR